MPTVPAVSITRSQIENFELLAQAGCSNEKTEGRKSRDTVPLKSL
jgi:hypothetical protein